MKWLGPGTEEVIEQLGHEGVKDLLVVPLSFVSDHIETLYEVDLLFEETARKAGITGYFRPDALNSHPVFIDALAHLVLDMASVRPAACGAGESVRGLSNWRPYEADRDRRRGYRRAVGGVGAAVA